MPTNMPYLGAVYRHYKGGIYTVLCCSVMEDTLENLVTYTDRGKQIWTRKLDNFLEVFEDGTPRFTPVYAFMVVLE